MNQSHSDQEKRKVAELLHLLRYIEDYADKISNVTVSANYYILRTYNDDPVGSTVFLSKQKPASVHATPIALMRHNLEMLINLFHKLVRETN